MLLNIAADVWSPSLAFSHSIWACFAPSPPSPLPTATQGECNKERAQTAELRQQLLAKETDMTVLRQQVALYKGRMEALEGDMGSEELEAAEMWGAQQDADSMTDLVRGVRGK
jgi:hypothetical protein